MSLKIESIRKKNLVTTTRRPPADLARSSPPVYSNSKQCNLIFVPPIDPNIAHEQAKANAKHHHISPSLDPSDLDRLYRPH